MKELTLVAHEWHNKETGHCYVDYIAHPGQDRFDGYTMKPLYYLPSELLKQRDELMRMMNSLMLSIAAHPDYVGGEEDDEWHTLLSLAEELVTKAEAK